VVFSFNIWRLNWFSMSRMVSIINLLENKFQILGWHNIRGKSLFIKKTILGENLVLKFFFLDE
jgi:hypothetical protein